MITKCTCADKYQDKTYGKGNRVHNEMTKDPTKCRCTVCGNEKTK